jgi:hypothetical protein
MLWRELSVAFCLNGLWAVANYAQSHWNHKNLDTPFASTSHIMSTCTLEEKYSMEYKDDVEGCSSDLCMDHKHQVPFIKKLGKHMELVAHKEDHAAVVAANFGVNVRAGYMTDLDLYMLNPVHIPMATDNETMWCEVDGVKIYNCMKVIRIAAFDGHALPLIVMKEYMFGDKKKSHSCIAQQMLKKMKC